MMTISVMTPPPMYMESPFVRLPRCSFPVERAEKPSTFAAAREPGRPYAATTEGGAAMPPRGTKKGTKRARQYEHIKDSLQERGSSEDEAEEIAARTVNKERARSGEARTSSKLSREDISSGRRGGCAATARVRAGARATSSTRKRRSRNIRGRSKMSKAELQKALGGR